VTRIGSRASTSPPVLCSATATYSTVLRGGLRQPTGTRMDTHYLTSHWDSVRGGLQATLDRFADSDLGFKPSSEAMSVHELMLHIAQEEDGEFQLGIEQDIQSFPPPYPPDEYTSLPEVRAKLDSVHAAAMHYLRALAEADLDREVATPWGKTARLTELPGHILEHEIHHRGELSLILGILGRQGLEARPEIRPQVSDVWHPSTRDGPPKPRGAASGLSPSPIVRQASSLLPTLVSRARGEPCPRSLTSISS
jgi:uncharacterized damage-inducible protein DinB